MKHNLILVCLLVLLANSLPVSRIFAADVSSLSDTLSTIKESVEADHTIQLTINDAWDAGDTLTIDFPDTFDTTALSNADDNDFDISEDGNDIEVVTSGACAANKIEITSINNGTSTLTFTLCAGSSSVSSSSIIIVEIGTNAAANGTGDSQIINQTAAENDTDALVNIAGTFGGSGTMALEIVSDNDISVSAVVDPRITCSFAGLTTSFASLVGPVTTSDTTTTITISTNAPNGFNLSVRDEGNGVNPGLYKSSAPTYLVGSADSSYANTATLTSDIDGYGIQGSTAGGSGASVSIAARYDQSGNAVGGLERTATTLASASAAVANRVVSVVHKAAVSGLANFGTYSDVITYVCTGVF